MQSKWLLLLLLLFCSSCGIYKTRQITKTDSIYIDRSVVVTERVVDTIITIKSDTVKYSFRQPQADTTINLSTSGGGKVTIKYLKGKYYITSIEREKAIPIKIYEKKVEYRNIYVRDKNKKVEVKRINYDWLTFLIISIIVFILVLKSNLKNYASGLPTKIKFW